MVGEREHHPLKGGVQPCIQNTMYELCTQKRPQNTVYRFCHQSGPGESSRRATTAKIHNCSIRVYLVQSKTGFYLYWTHFLQF